MITDQASFISVALSKLVAVVMPSLFGTRLRMHYKSHSLQQSKQMSFELALELI